MNSIVRIPIKNKIVTENNINEIIDIILNLKNYNTPLKDEIIDIKIEYINGIEVSCNDKKVLEDIKFKEIEINKINIHYFDYNNKNFVYINITNGNSNYDNEIRIESKDDKFIGYINSKINQWLEYLPGQNSIVSYIRKHQLFTYFVVVILSIVSIIFLNDLLSRFDIEISNLTYFVETIISILGYMKIIDSIEELFPIVEINVNKNGKRYSIRKYLGWLFGVIVVPMFINALYDLIKYILIK